MLKNRRDTTSGASAALKVSEWPVRRKIFLVLAIPVVLAAVFGGLRVNTELLAAQDYSTTKDRVTVLAPAIDYLAAVERLTLPAQLADSIDPTTTPQNAYDTAATTLKTTAATASLTSTQAALVRAMTEGGDQLRNGTGTGSTADPAVVISDMARNVSSLLSSTVNTQSSPGVRTQALVQSVNGRLSLTQQQLLIAQNAQGGGLGATWLAAEIGVEGSELANLKVLLLKNSWVSSLTAANGTRLGSAAGGTGVKQLNATPDLFVKYDKLNDGQLVKIDTALNSLASTSRDNALRDAAIIFAALLASLILAVSVARLLIRPIRRVRDDALAVATTHLPEAVSRIRSGQEPEPMVPIAVTTHEEIGQLARAVEDMHRQAVTLASGEAQLRSQVGAMFVTLSRRNNTLVNQQLSLIESLEQNEEDPQRLEQLFSLDHLATRMRRTAESLVILGGTSGRSVGFEELTVSDAVHAAVSEVQDYQRVIIESTPERRIVGRTASDVVHLLAELLDNALSYSPPGSNVRVSAGYAEDGKSIQIEVIDSGLGMAGADLAAANDSLKRGGEVTVDTARRMGLFVVSRLADEHGLTVRLARNTQGGGLTATVLMPASVLVALQTPAYLPSLLDEPEEVVEETTPVLVLAEESDPYLDRIEEAIAAVTGLPRRSPGPVREPVAVSTEPVSMFDPVPPLELVAPESEDVPAAEPVEAEIVSETNDDELADVVTGDFGGEAAEPADDHEDAVVVAESDETDEVVAESDDADEVVAESEETDEVVAESDEADVVVAESDETDEVVAESDEADVVVAESDETDEVVAESTDEPADEPVPTAAAQLAAPAAPPVEEETAPEVVTAEPVRLTIRRPHTVSPAASALEGELVDVPSEGEDSPIFGSLQSNWLSGDEAGETWTDPAVDAGWSAAKVSDQGDNTLRTAAGLPVRRPGGRLVPGGVGNAETAEPVAAVRDPEAIRNRLAAHAAGVSRGRAAATAQPTTDDYAHEETGPA